MEHWDLRTLDVRPHQPQILHSKRGESRTIAIQLPAGERLQDHEVHERAHLIVVDGEVEVGADGTTVAGTDVVDASAVDVVAAVRELTGGDGVDIAFEATGVPEVVAQAMAMLDYAGTAVAIGVPPIPAEVTLAWNGSPHAAYPRKTSLLITDGGDPIPSEDFPEMARWALDGSLDLEGMVTRELGLEDLDEAFRAMLAGEVIRSVVVFPS